MRKKPSFWAKAVILAAVSLVLMSIGSFAAQTPQIPLAGSAIPKWVNQLPTLNIVQPGTNQLVLWMNEFQFPILPPGAVAGYTGTWVWGYVPEGQAGYTSYLGPVVLAQRYNPTEIKFINNLGTAAGTNVLAWKYSTDQTLHWADPLNLESNPYAGVVPAFGSPGSWNYGQSGANTFDESRIPAVVHLHGGEVPPQLDGGPDAWVTSDGQYWGHGFWTLGNTPPTGQFPQGTNPNGSGANYFVYRYPNTQEASNIWFHDHVLGITRLNVYAGLAGAYLISDPTLVLPAGLDPYGIGSVGGVGGETIIPLVIQDRMFDTNGQLFFPADSAANILWTPNPDHPYWVPEFVGDTIVVNGKAWPTVGSVAAPLQAKRYRFLFLNGSNARTYELFLIDPVTKLMGPPLWVIGTDGGYLDKPVKIDPNAATNNKLVIMPGERYDVIIDFAGFANKTLLMRNTGRTPYPKGASPQGSTLGQIVQFVIGAAPAADTGFNPASGAALRPPMQRLVNPAAGALGTGVTLNLTRLLTLNEVMGLPQVAVDPVTGVTVAYPGGPLEILLNNTKWTGLNKAGSPVSGGTPYPTGDPGTQGQIYYTELPKEGDTELWEIVNLTADAHPIHLHLVQFQLMNRQNFNFNKYMGDYTAAFGGVIREADGPPLAYAPSAATGNKYGGNPDVTPRLQGPIQPPLPQEAGWKDTVTALPGQVTRLVVRWAPTDVAVGDTTNNFFPFNPDGGHGFVWHCHIIDHEDNEMMRPTQILPKAGVNRTVTVY
jgi:FtsP/CotA-like multicopper oxidase with cupredoxin domain